MKQQLLFVICVVAAISPGFAQCMLVPVSLGERVNNSQVIVEGKVLSQQSCWDKRHTHIYTVNRVEVYKVFKGDIPSSPIEILTEGGIAGDRMEYHTSTLSLEAGETGIFMLNPVQEELDNYTLTHAYDVYSSMQGFIRYHSDEMSAQDVFNRYENIVQDVYPAIGQITNRSFTELKKPEVPENNFSSRVPPVISGFSPATITAGTKQKLTINGSGFGLSQGASNYVEFKNCNDGGSTYIKPIASEYTLWSDTKIEVYVPSTAGTGTIRVRSSGQTATSSGILTVSYANLNVQYENVNYMTDLVNKSGGGYLWRMNVNFDANTNAKKAFTRALENWRCSVFVNWSLSATTVTDTVGSAPDGTSIIIFENPLKPLPSGVLGRCTSWWSGCGFSTINVWYADELDIQFDNSTNWYYGTGSPAGNQYDFESVVLHELGHGLQLAHVINDLDVMHYSIGPGDSKKVLNSDDVAGANLVMNRSVFTNACGPGKMIALTSSNCSLTGEPAINAADNSFIVYPNPAGKEVSMDIAFDKRKSFSVEVVNVLGETIIYRQVEETERYQSVLDLSGYAGGIYVVKVNDGQNIFSRKIIVSR